MSILLGSNNEPLKLTKFHIDGIIHNNSAEFTFHQHYLNTSNEEIHAKYIFPCIPNITLVNLSTYKTRSNSSLKIEEVHKVLKSYEDAKNAGENSYTLEKLQEYDMMVYSVEKIAANEGIQVDTVFACKAEKMLSEPYWKLKIPKELFPPGHQEIPYTADIHSFWDYSLRQYNKFLLESGNFIKLEVDFGVAGFMNFSPDNDLEVVYYFETPQESYLTIQKDPRINRYSFYLSYKPDKNLLDLSEERLAGEFAIFLDRNASIDSKIPSATEAAALFIRSLPENCYFNVIIFGKPIFEKSRKYDQCSIDEAYLAISSDNNDITECDFFGPLKYVLESPRIPGYPLSIFVVTNRSTWDNKTKITRLIKKYKEAKINTIGIDSDGTFIKELSRIGKGTSYMSNSPNEIKQGVLRSLKQALSPTFTDICLSDNRIFDFVLPNETFNVTLEEKIEISGVFKKGLLPKSIDLQFKTDRVGPLQHINWSIAEGQISISSSILILESKKYLKQCDQGLSVRKSKEYQVEGDFASFNIERYKKNKLTEDQAANNDLEENAIDIKKSSQSYSETKVQEITNSERNLLKPATKLKQSNKQAKEKTVNVNSTPNVQSKTVSDEVAYQAQSDSCSIDVALQVKRGRNKKLDAASPRKKAKVKEEQIQSTEINKLEIAELPEIFQNMNEVKGAENEYEVEKILHLQKAEGYWEFSKNLSDIVYNLLGYDLGISKLDHKLITALIVAFLEEKCIKYKDLSDLIVMKAKRWLAKNDQILIRLSDFNTLF
ncbi:unnamed protein product [Blepharisma stoltei]|uniref:VIT domain-containing protein n=1 Tax=Blepharisma stoltei TaxID=1481888 RepID=A0AAU9J1J0_9CILI|nr:unnamed protein product [Blepharisma stoltei]